MGRAEGRTEGHEEGRTEALAESLARERRILSGQILRRFGPIPEWAQQRVAALSASDLEQMSLRLLDAVSLNELLG